jgi:hypothetical protein
MPALILPNPGASIGFGDLVVGVGDMNEDGYSDVLVDTGGASVGVYLGSKTGIPTMPSVTLSLGPGAGPDNVVESAAGAGDVKRDGFAGVIVGDTTVSNVYFFVGGTTLGSGPASTLPAPSGSAPSTFGGSVGGTSN